MKRALTVAFVLAASTFAARADSSLAGPTDALQPAKSYGYYRCVEQHPTGKRYCYKVPRLDRPAITL